MMVFDLDYHLTQVAKFKEFKDYFHGDKTTMLNTIFGMLTPGFVEFFFLNRDDGKHRYEYYIKGDPKFINAQTITRLQEDGSRTCFNVCLVFSFTVIRCEISIRLIYGCRQDA